MVVAGQKRRSDERLGTMAGRDTSGDRLLTQGHEGEGIPDG